MSNEVLAKDLDDVVIIVDEYTDEDLKDITLNYNNGKFGVRFVDYDDNNVRDTEFFNSLYDIGETYADPETALEEGERIFDARFSNIY